MRCCSRPSSRAPQTNITATIASVTALTAIRMMPRTVDPDMTTQCAPSTTCRNRITQKVRGCKRRLKVGV